MANYDEVVSLINGNIYPHVARTADPLLVRPDMLSLMVGDIVYNARTKNGLGAKGFMIYVNGNGAPVYEKIATTNADATSEFGIQFNSSTGSAAVKDDDVKKALELKAKEWLDGLEKAIAKEPSDSAIKKAIDRLCWQLHYDITESHTNFPEVFANNDFADVQIDRYGATNWDGTTLKTSIADNYTNISNSVSGGATTICGGSSLQSLSDAMSGAISTFDTNLNGSDSASTKNTIKSALNTVGAKLVPDGNYYSISECLRDHDTINGKTTFSIARSLRESGEDSVSQATYDQTQLESEEFSDIELRLGEPGSDNSIWDSVNTINGNVGNRLSNSDPTILERVGNPGSGNSVWGTVSGISSSVGNSSSLTGTIYGMVNTMNKSMHGDGTKWGFVSTNGNDYFVKAATPSGGWSWTEHS